MHDGHHRTAIPADGRTLTADRPRQAGLIELDAELREAVPPAYRLRVQQALRATIGRFGAGPIALSTLRLPSTAFALVVVRGSLTCETRLGAARMTDLVLAADVIPPWPPETAAPGATSELIALEPVALAVLDRRFLEAATHWPQLMLSVQRRLAERTHRLAVHAAICQLPRVEQRLMAMMQFLAERIGRVGLEGTVLSWPRSHEALGHLIGARRSTVTLALAVLRERGELGRLADGTWILPHRTEGPCATCATSN